MVIYNFESQDYEFPFKGPMKNHDIRSLYEGRGFIKNKNTLFVEESRFGRLVQFDELGNIDFQYVNKGKDGFNYVLSWSRLINRKVGEKVVELANKNECDV